MVGGFVSDAEIWEVHKPQIEASARFIKNLTLDAKKIETEKNQKILKNFLEKNTLLLDTPFLNFNRILFLYNYFRYPLYFL